MFKEYTLKEISTTLWITKEKPKNDTIDFEQLPSNLRSCMTRFSSVNRSVKSWNILQKQFMSDVLSFNMEKTWPESFTSHSPLRKPTSLVGVVCTNITVPCGRSKCRWTGGCRYRLQSQVHSSRMKDTPARSNASWAKERDSWQMASRQTILVCTKYRYL